MKQTITTILLLIVTASTYAQTIPSYVPTSGLVAYYPFDGNANDISGNGNNGTVNGATLTIDRSGNSNKAYSFNGTSNSISFNLNSMSNSIPSSSEFTSSVWVKTNDLNGPLISMQGSGGFEYDCHIGTLADIVQSPGNYGILVRDNCCGTGNNIFGATVSNNQWHMLTYVRLSNGTLKLYKDGVLDVVSSSGHNGALNLSNLQMAFGADLAWANAGAGCGSCNSVDQQHLNGTLDEIGFWNRALTEIEITALYTNITCTTTTSTMNTTICPSALPYTWNGKTLTGAGSLIDTLTNTGGCDSIATLNLTVTTQPSPTANNICAGSTLQLTNAISGGVWASLNNKATVNSTGLVTAKYAGAAVITYKKSGVTTTYNITVNANPQMPGIAYGAGAINPQIGAGGAGKYCINKTFTVLGVPSGGVFSNSNNSVLSISCSGVVNTLAVGSTTLTYTYTNAAGCSNSRSITGTIVNCASRAMNNTSVVMDSDFALFPNPAKNKVNLFIEKLLGEGQIIVTNLMGKQLKTQLLSMGTNTIDIANLSKGMYFVSVITNDGKTTKKLVVE